MHPLEEHVEHELALGDVTDVETAQKRPSVVASGSAWPRNRCWARSARNSLESSRQSPPAASVSTTAITAWAGEKPRRRA
jgi:hypothetical protein